MADSGDEQRFQTDGFFHNAQFIKNVRVLAATAGNNDQTVMLGMQALNSSQDLLFGTQVAR